MENYKINSKKYKTIGELLNAHTRSITMICSKLEDNIAIEYIVNWLLRKKVMKGNLTNRIKSISSKCVSNHILSKIFLSSTFVAHQNINILDSHYIDSLIKPLYQIHPSMCGTFFDYIIRRIISEINNEEFHDMRLEECMRFYKKSKTPYQEYTQPDEQSDDPSDEQSDEQSDESGHRVILDEAEYLQFDPSKKMWWFNPHTASEYGACRTYIHPIECEKNRCGTMKIGDIFQCISKEDKYMKIIFNAAICYIFYIEYMEELDYYPEHKCKYVRNGGRTQSEGHYNCNYPICRVESYIKIKDTANYKTSDIIPSIFISSISHSETFLTCFSCINMKIVGQMHLIISNATFLESFSKHIVTPLTEYFTNYIRSKSVLLNPPLGGKYTYAIPADCDIVIGDTLIDIKCTVGDNQGYEILQLLGYSALLQTNPLYNKNIQQISILNLMEGNINFYDTSHITASQYLSFLQLLHNK